MTIHEAITRRVAGVLDFYVGCAVSDDLLRIINKEMGGVIVAACKDAGFKKNIPFVLRVRHEGEGSLVVYSVPFSTS